MRFLNTQLGRTDQNMKPFPASIRLWEQDEKGMVMRMSVWRKLFAAVVLMLAGTMFLYPDHSYACSCASLTPQEAYEIADIVFAGRVYEVNNPSAGAKIQSSASLVQNSFEVKEVWKGALDWTVDIRAAQSTASCGYVFAVDEEYLVYAIDRGDWLETGLCNRTKPLSQADEDLRFLGAGATNAGYGEIVVPEPSSNGHQAVTYLISAVIVILAASAIIWWRRT